MPPNPVTITQAMKTAQAAIAEVQKDIAEVKCRQEPPG
jgi:hypothetical protein